MGYRVGEVCYGTPADAEAAYYSSQAEVYVPSSTTQGQFYYWSGSAWRIKAFTINSVGTIAPRFDVLAPAHAFASCEETTNTSSFFDGMALGWGIVLAMTIAWGIRQMKGQLR